MGTIWEQMAARAAGRRRALERVHHHRDRVLQQHADEVRRVGAVVDRTERAEESRALRARQEADAARFDAEVKEELGRVAALLRAAAAEPARDLSYFRNAMPTDGPPTVDDVAAPPRPEWPEYAPPPPGLFGRRRHERSLMAARAQLDAALVRHDQYLQRALGELSREHQIQVACRHEAHRAEWVAEAAEAYAALVAQVILAVLDGCFRAIAPDVVDAVSVSGHVRTIDPATGRPDHPCLITGPGLFARMDYDTWRTESSRDDGYLVTTCWGSTWSSRTCRPSNAEPAGTR